MNHKIKTILIDDEFHSTEVLEDLIVKNFEDIEVLAKFNESLKALEYLKIHAIDLVFLDIEMPFLNGFELMEQLSQVKTLPSIVFVTAYDQYAIKAFKFAAYDYILKPAEKEDIQLALDKFKSQKLNQTEKQWDYLVSLFKQQNNFEKIVLSVQDGFEIVEIKDIVHVDSDSNYSTVYLENKKPIVISRTLKDFENTLKDKGFLRIHNSHLVNLNKIIKFVKADGGHVVMNNNKQLNVSKSKKEDLIRFFDSLK